MYLGTYLSEKFLHHPDDEACSELNNKLQEYMDAMAGLCEEEAAQIMCKSLTNMFKGLHADKLHNCQFSCLKPTATAVDLPSDTGEADSQAAPVSHHLNGSAAPESARAASTAMAILFILIAAVIQ